ncbi:16S rRNA (cytidine(1402)-2'-O)-methyltransferase [Spirochaetota bacterium]
MEQGKLYIISTPIGNMDDITIRAVNTLKNKIDIAYCEDTRQTSKLLNHYNVQVPKLSLHSHSSEKKINRLIDNLKQGKNAAYLTDSGTPGVSDPGNKIVNYARANGIKVIPIPGPSALTSIISVSGFRGKAVAFSGFLSKKGAKRKKELLELKNFDGVIVIYESPHRIKKTLTDICEIFNGHDIFIGREMTKMYEEFIHGTSDDILKNLDNIKEKGEFTIAISNRT